MAAKSPKVALILLFIHACLAVLVPTGLAQLPQIPGLFPFPGLGGLPGPTTQCFSSLVNIPGCLTEVFGSFINGHFGIIGSACCKAITEIEDNCLGKLFPFNPVFGPLLNSTCGQSGNTGANKALFSSGAFTIRASKSRYTTMLVISFKWSRGYYYLSQGLSPGQSGQDILQCWSSLTSIEGCINEIYGSLSKGKFGVSGPACCKAITDVTDKCWPKMFPLNPMFPPLLKSNCAPIVGAAPTA
uniref:Prolamin-like domain-containing protein n=1 Tax=Fagus sylvatica TaxID=28930 RepID=A0A2N9G4A7_FAGSY